MIQKPLRGDLYRSFLFCNWLEQTFFVPIATNLPSFLLSIFLVRDTVQPIPSPDQLGLTLLEVPLKQAPLHREIP